MNGKQQDNYSRYMYHISQGQALYKSLRFSEALVHFETAVELEPRSHWAWNERGNALKRLGRHREAMGCYQQAIHLDKAVSYPFPYIGIGDIHREQQQYAEAIIYYDRAIQIRRHPWALNGKAQCLYDLGQKDTALRLTEEAIRIRPQFLFPHMLKGDILFDRGEYPAALKSYQDAFCLIHGDAYELRRELENKIEVCQERPDPSPDERKLPLSPTGNDIRQMLALLWSEDEQKRIDASCQLDLMAKGGRAGQIISKSPFERLISALSDTNPSVRRNIQWVAGNLSLQGYSYEVAQSGILRKIAANLDDPMGDVRSAAAWSLAVVAEAGQGIAVADTGAVERCIRCLSDRDSEIQACAALALDKIAFYASPEPVVRGRGVEALAVLITGRDKGVRGCALWALWSIASRGYANALREVESLITDLKLCAQDSNLEVRKAAVSIIGELPTAENRLYLQQKDFERVLITCIGSRSNRVRGAAIWAAGRWAEKGISDTLIQLGVKDAIRRHLNDSAKVHIFYHNESRWKERSIGGVAGDVLKKFDSPPERQMSDIVPCKPDYRTAYFVAQHLLDHLRHNNIQEARKSIVHLEEFVCGNDRDRVLHLKNHLLIYSEEGIDEIAGELVDNVELLKEDILKEAMR